MNQYKAIYEVRRKLKEIMADTDSKTAAELQEIDQELAEFHSHGIDFKMVVDGLDDSMMITDKEGKCLYINPAYTRNTDIYPEEVLGKTIKELKGTGKLFTGGAVEDVLKTEKPTFRLSKTFKGDSPLTGYVMGTPLFNEAGQLHQVVALSRPIIHLKALKNDFNAFMDELRALDSQSKTSTSDAQARLSPSMVGKDTSLKSIWTMIPKIAQSDATVLITGESGTGKEVLADEIFRCSRRSNENFVKINCASIPAHLLESELFGYEKGAFSGANAKGKPGLFEMANNGTLMLDEIGDMPMDLQVKLLRAIQSQQITRIGGIKPINLNIRFLALTNCDLKEKIANGTFRRDLFYRLNVIPIKVPPLRDRTEDIEALCQHFIEIFCQKYNCNFSLSDHQYDYLRSYNWPGNIRELENIMEYLVLCSSGIGEVDDDLIRNILDISGEQSSDNKYEVSENQWHPDSDLDLTSAVESYEKHLIEEALARSSNLREAGRILNINASTVSRKIKQYNIDYPAKK